MTMVSEGHRAVSEQRKAGEWATPLGSSSIVLLWDAGIRDCMGIMRKRTIRRIRLPESFSFDPLLSRSESKTATLFRLTGSSRSFLPSRSQSSPSSPFLHCPSTLQQKPIFQQTIPKILLYRRRRSCTSDSQVKWNTPWNVTCNSCVRCCGRLSTRQPRTDLRANWWIWRFSGSQNRVRPYGIISLVCPVIISAMHAWIF